jgi:hypothetical protein
MEGKISLDQFGSSYNAGYQQPADYVPPTVAPPGASGDVAVPVAQAVPQLQGSIGDGQYGSTSAPAPAPPPQAPGLGAMFGAAVQGVGAVGGGGADGMPSFATMAAVGSAATVAGGMLDGAKNAIGAEPGSLSARAKDAVAGNLRSFSDFTGCGVTAPYSVPTCGEIAPRLSHNLVHYSANYIVLTLVIAVLSAITSFKFLFSAVLLAYVWNLAIKAAANDTTVKVGGIEMGAGQARICAIAMSIVMFFVFGKDIILHILTLSLVSSVAHAFARNSKPDTSEGYYQAPGGPHVEL